LLRRTWPVAGKRLRGGAARCSRER
jgi:hypothetical protein